MEKQELKPPRPVVDRLTVVDTIYHHRARRNPTSFDVRFTRNLSGSEQPYVREQHLTEEWQPLDCGWIEGCAMLSIKNLAGQYLVRNPTPEAKAELEQQVVEVSMGVDGASWLVHPGESMRGCPIACKSLYVRCRKGECDITVMLVPS